MQLVLLQAKENEMSPNETDALWELYEEIRRELLEDWNQQEGAYAIGAVTDDVIGGLLRNRRTIT